MEGMYVEGIVSGAAWSCACEDRLKDRVERDMLCKLRFLISRGAAFPVLMEDLLTVFWQEAEKLFIMMAGMVCVKYKMS